MSDDTPQQTPLVDLLRRVPADACHVYAHSGLHHQHIPYGRLCHEAAAELDALRAEVARLEQDKHDLCLERGALMMERDRLRAALEAVPNPSRCRVRDAISWYDTTRREALDG